MFGDHGHSVLLFHRSDRKATSFAVVMYNGIGAIGSVSNKTGIGGPRPQHCRCDRINAPAPWEIENCNTTPELENWKIDCYCYERNWKKQDCPKRQSKPGSKPSGMTKSPNGQMSLKKERKQMMNYIYRPFEKRNNKYAIMVVGNSSRTTIRAGG
jgi:hypothetical protein